MRSWSRRRPAGPVVRRIWIAGGVLILGGALSACSPGHSSATGTTGSNPPTSTLSSTSPTTSTTTTTVAPTTTLAAAAPQPCAAGDVRLAKNDETGAAGTSALGIGISSSGAACTLDGFPVVTLVGKGGPMTTTVVHTGQGPAFRIDPSEVVVSGTGAGFVVEWSDVQVNGETSCPTATSMSITLPGFSAPIRLAYRLMACGGPQVSVSAVLTTAEEQAQFSG